MSNRGRDELHLRTLVCEECHQPFTCICSARKKYCDPCRLKRKAEITRIRQRQEWRANKAARDSMRPAKRDKCGARCEDWLWCNENIYLCPGVRLQKLLESV